VGDGLTDLLCTLACRPFLSEVVAFLPLMADFEPHPSPLVLVLVVDDYAPFRGFICATLKCIPEFQVIGEAADGLEAIQKTEALQPDLVLLDIGLPKLNGLETAHRISRLAPGATILYISQETDPDVWRKP